jgi:hypothetical protein
MNALGEILIGASVIAAITGMFFALSAKPADGALSPGRLGLGVALVVAAIATVVLVLRH